MRESRGLRLGFCMEEGSLLGTGINISVWPFQYWNSNVWEIVKKSGNSIAILGNQIKEMRKVARHDLDLNHLVYIAWG